MYKIKITCKGSNRPQDLGSIFDYFTENRKTLMEVREYIIDRYGKMPSRNHIYIDVDGIPQIVGFVHSYWNRDFSHDSKSWYQTDWVEVVEYSETPLKKSEILSILK